MWPMLAIVRGVAEDADLLVCVCVFFQHTLLHLH